MYRIRLAVFLAIVVSMLFSCEESSKETEPEIVVSSIEASPGSVLMFPSGTQKLTATLYDGDGNTVEGELVWTSSSDATASIDITGNVTGLTAGTAVITVSHEDLTATATITIAAPIGLTKDVGNPVILGGAAGSWEEILWQPAVNHVGSSYQMWYHAIRESGYMEQIGYASSDDGLVWVKDNTNPVLEPSGDDFSPDNKSVGSPSVMFDGSEYKMWYHAVDIGGNMSICYATSADGVSWEKYASNPVFVATQSWANSTVAEPTVVFNGSEYMMWFSAGKQTATTAEATLANIKFGLATSPDGINWTAYGGNPVLSRTSGWYDDYVPGDPNVFIKDDLYYILYMGLERDPWGFGDGHICLAVSEDGREWVKYLDNALLSRGEGGSADYNGVGPISCLYEDGVVKVWYTAKSQDQVYSYNFASSE